MLAELSITPVGEGAHLSEPLARAVELVIASGLDYQVTALGTLLEGEPDAVWRLLRDCHEALGSDGQRVVTHIVLDDGPTERRRLARGVHHLERALGHEVRSTPD